MRASGPERVEDIGRDWGDVNALLAVADGRLVVDDRGMVMAVPKGTLR